MTVVRCPNCYFPMAYSFLSDLWHCKLCRTALTRERLVNRPRWRQLVDQLTGMHL